MPLPRRGRLSGMQRDVLSLYREFLREIRRRSSGLAGGTGSKSASASESGSASGSGPGSRSGSASGPGSGPGSGSGSGWGLKEFVESEFRRHAGVDKKEYQMIEYLLRKGRKQLQLVKDGNTTGFQIARNP